MSKEELISQLNEASNQVTKEEAENFQLARAETLNRRERKERLKYYKSVLKEHLKRKPTFDVTQDSPEEQELRIARLRSWATRYAVLMNKIQEFGAKRNSTGSNEQNSEGDEVAQPGAGEIGAE